jgi:phosphoribosylanthranilate isomerase
MSLLVKICGLTTQEALDVALTEGADMVGFVFFPPSPRNLSFEAARKLVQQVQGRAQTVALSVDADDDWLAASIDAINPDILQLHGMESPERVGAIRSRFKRPVMKAIAVEQEGDLRLVAHYVDIVDRLLFDARAPRDATRPGGLGKVFDWHLLQRLETGVSFMLSGGLDAGNVGDALRITRASGCDVSSGVERAPGEKDPDKIRAFIRAARGADKLLSSSAPTSTPVYRSPVS